MTILNKNKKTNKLIGGQYCLLKFNNSFLTNAKTRVSGRLHGKFKLSDGDSIGYASDSENEEHEDKKENEEIEEKQSLISKFRDIFSNKGLDDKAICFMMLFLIIIFSLITICVRYVYCTWYCKPTIILDNTWYYIFAFIFPLIVWVFSTTSDYWCYLNRKMFMIKVCLLHAFLILLMPFYKLVHNIVVNQLIRVHISPIMTTSTLLNMGMAMVIYTMAFISYVLYVAIARHIFNYKFKMTVNRFKISHYVDFRKNKENLYDFSILNDLKTGKKINTKENDRFTGTLVDGPSGTGKTSTIFLNGIYNDLCKKVRNLDKLQEALYLMVSEGEAELVGEPHDRMGMFDPTSITPKPKYEKKYKKLINKYPNCGMTVMAPNHSLGEDVAKLCDALGLKYNWIDPMPSEITNERKKFYTGINPFMVSLNLSLKDLAVEVSEKATLFADVMLSLNEAKGGKSDPYFAGINKSVTTNVSIVCMLGIPLVNNRQATILDIQEGITDFDYLVNLVNAVEAKYGMTGDKPVCVGDGIKRARGKSSLSPVLAEKENSEASFNSTTYATSIVEEEQLNESPVVDPNNTKNPFYMVLRYIRKDLLGERREKMEDHSSGLRNQINQFVLDPHIQDILTFENAIDFDRVFANGEITIVNTALQKGSSTSSAFGEFFILLMKQAMFRRKINTRHVRHFWWIDELPTYLTAEIESLYSLARQYRVGIVSAIQGLDQTEKNATTRYLKGVLLGSGTHIIFGRCNSTEMKLYCELAGLELVEATRQSVNQTSLLKDNTSMSFQTTKEIKQVNALEGSSIRNRDFLEVTLMTSDNGFIDGFREAKAYFLPPSRYKKLRRKHFNWVKYMRKEQLKDFINSNEFDKGISESFEERQADIVSSGSFISNFSQADNELQTKEPMTEELFIKSNETDEHSYSVLVENIDNIDEVPSNKSDEPKINSKKPSTLTEEEMQKALELINQFL